MERINFDIETGPLPEDQIAIPEFKPAATCKKPEAIEKSIAEKRAKFMDQLALSPLTGKVLTIGYIDSDCTVIINPPEMPEKQQLEVLSHFQSICSMLPVP